MHPHEFELHQPLQVIFRFCAHESVQTQNLFDRESSFVGHKVEHERPCPFPLGGETHQPLQAGLVILLLLRTTLQQCLHCFPEVGVAEGVVGHQVEQGRPGPFPFRWETHKPLKAGLVILLLLPRATRGLCLKQIVRRTPKLVVAKVLERWPHPLLVLLRLLEAIPTSSCKHRQKASCAGAVGACFGGSAHHEPIRCCSTWSARVLWRAEKPQTGTSKEAQNGDQPATTRHTWRKRRPRAWSGRWVCVAVSGSGGGVVVTEVVIAGGVGLQLKEHRLQRLSPRNCSAGCPSLPTPRGLAGLGLRGDK